MAARVAPSEIISGAIFTASGVAFAWMASQHRLGTASEMGPGYFPMLLALLLIGIGCILLVRAFFIEDMTEVAYKAHPIFFITLSLAIFALTVNRLGVIVAVFLSAMVAAYGGDKFRWFSAIIMSVLLSFFCWLVFFKALGLPFPAIGNWLRF